VVLAAAGITVHGSSHREALAVLNEPCADNTDTYAWVSNGSHDKLYLIMDFNPLHEPGQGNHGPARRATAIATSSTSASATACAIKPSIASSSPRRLQPEALPNPADNVGGQQRAALAAHGGTETMTVTRSFAPGINNMEVLGRNLPVLPNNHGPQTDRLIYGLGTLPGIRAPAIVRAAKRASTISRSSIATSTRCRMADGSSPVSSTIPISSTRKGIFDLVNLNANDLGGIRGARRPPGKDVFTGFNIFSIALEVPYAICFPNGVPHNGSLQASSTDSLLRVWSRITRQATQTVDANQVITGVTGSGEYVQVGRNALPLFNAGLIGAQRQTLYLHTDPTHDVSNFGADILYPVLVRDAEALGIYRALGVADGSVATLKGPRLDIIRAINLGRPIPVADGFTGDVITLDAAIDSSFPNGRRMGGGTVPNRNQVNVNSVLISLIVAGDASAGLAKGVEENDKNYLDRFPFLAPAHQGLLQGHWRHEHASGSKHSDSVTRSNRSDRSSRSGHSRIWIVLLPATNDPNVPNARTIRTTGQESSVSRRIFVTGDYRARVVRSIAVRARHVDRAGDVLAITW
jgi:hypothetical protein